MHLSDVNNYLVYVKVRGLVDSIEFAVRSELIAPSDEVHELLAQGMTEIDADHPGELKAPLKEQLHRQLAELTGAAWRSNGYAMVRCQSGI
tara:strand:+ start:1171 stop:1443 length:273 start_codon:yes stop_codon:yes gene_type:complete